MKELFLRRKVRCHRVRLWKSFVAHKRTNGPACEVHSGELQSANQSEDSLAFEKLAVWFLGELPNDYPKDRLRGPQGRKNLRKLLNDETNRETLVGRRIPAYPSGIIVSRVRRGIIWFNILRIQFWIDDVRDWMAFTALRRESRTLEEIASWRDHYYLFCFVWYVLNLLFLPWLPPRLRVASWSLSGLFLLDTLAGTAGSALVWSAKSVSHERTFVTSIMAYVGVIIAFAGFYRACDCLNASNPDALQALYFSTVVATTLGFGDILPLNSADRNFASHLGLFLVLAQLALSILFVLVFVNIFLARSLSFSEHQPDGETSAAKKT
jgi:hypothetical protein